MNYEQDIRIEDSSLDLECLEQATLFMKYAKYATETRRTYDLAKEAFEIMKADLDKKIRSDPDKFKIEKITETVVQNTIIMQSGYRESNELLLNAKYEVDMAQNAVNAINQKKDMLEALIKLHGQSYFAGPRTPRDLSKERELKQRKVDSGVAKHLTRSRT